MYKRQAGAWPRAAPGGRQRAFLGDRGGSSGCAPGSATVYNSGHKHSLTVRVRGTTDMSRGINKVILIGHLGADPETRAMPSGMTVANLRLATSENWKDKQSGENQERTEWHNVAMFGRLAEIAGEYLRKGSQVYIEGRLRTRKWQDKSGADRYTTEIVANDMQMIGGRGGASGGGGGEPRERSAQAEPAAAGAGAGAGSGAGAEDFDDDIPF